MDFLNTSSQIKPFHISEAPTGYDQLDIKHKVLIHPSPHQSSPNTPDFFKRLRCSPLACKKHIPERERERERESERERERERENEMVSLEISERDSYEQLWRVRVLPRQLWLDAPFSDAFFSTFIA